MKMKVRRHAAPDMSTARDLLPLRHPIANVDERPAFLQMQIAALRAVTVVHRDAIIWHVHSVAVVRVHDSRDDAGTRCAYIRAFRHFEVEGKFLPIAMADDASIALNAQSGDASG